MVIDFSSLSNNQIYHCMTQTLIPRPVAWVMTENPVGDFNLAPYSYFTAVCASPPLIMISVGLKPDGDFKDTRINIAAREHFVVHLAHRELAQEMTETSRSLSFGDSELAGVGLSTTEFDGFVLPRLAQCRVAMGCRLYEVQEIGPNRQAMIFGEVERLYVDDEAVTTDGASRFKVDASKLDPVGRLGANEYTAFGDILTIPRPR